MARRTRRRTARRRTDDMHGRASRRSEPPHFPPLTGHARGACSGCFDLPGHARGACRSLDLGWVWPNQVSRYIQSTQVCPASVPFTLRHSTMILEDSAFGFRESAFRFCHGCFGILWHAVASGIVCVPYTFLMCSLLWAWGMVISCVSCCQLVTKCLRFNVE